VVLYRAISQEAPEEMARNRKPATGR
jgi:hypothetical protein